MLKKALRREGRLISVPGHHAKILIFGTTAVVGSSNISKSSRQDLFESAVITDRPEVVSKAVQIIEKLVKQGAILNDKFVNRVLKIKVERRSGMKYRAKSVVSDVQPKAWIIVGAEDANATSLSWRSFKKLARRAGVTRGIGRYTCRRLSEEESSAYWSVGLNKFLPY